MARTPTRRHHSDIEAAMCPPCSVPSSMRHLWAERPRYEGARRRIGREFGVPAVWWAQQPRVTATSGWVTTDSGWTLENRALRQVAAARLALVSFRDLCGPGRVEEAVAVVMLGGPVPGAAEVEEEGGGEGGFADPAVMVAQGAPNYRR